MQQKTNKNLFKTRSNLAACSRRSLNLGHELRLCYPGCKAGESGKKQLEGEGVESLSLLLFMLLEQRASSLNLKLFSGWRLTWA
ncbi:hypothetical protein [Shewanella salipaludis]|uniref:Uncharacterized protein n=1 Tax=Shewanella salipaludis TaxID=2723052 RepID=A0A972FW72_9GAMM|nr:hypothetical protein [Shewanella salipaludis]NMH67203.1 hypothetical protein [Shewanella salipaludis]